MIRMKIYTILLVCLLCFDISQGAVYTPLDFKYIDVSNHEMVKHAQSVAAYILDSNVTYDAKKKVYYVKKGRLERNIIYVEMNFFMNEFLLLIVQVF